jgi:hypothetical protein
MCMEPNKYFAGFFLHFYSKTKSENVKLKFILYELSSFLHTKHHIRNVLKMISPRVDEIQMWKGEKRHVVLLNMIFRQVLRKVVVFAREINANWSNSLFISSFRVILIVKITFQFIAAIPHQL